MHKKRILFFLAPLIKGSPSPSGVFSLVWCKTTHLLTCIGFNRFRSRYGTLMLLPPTAAAVAAFTAAIAAAAVTVTAAAVAVNAVTVAVTVNAVTVVTAAAVAAVDPHQLEVG